jgi:hypothetical protein
MIPFPLSTPRISESCLVFLASFHLHTDPFFSHQTCVPLFVLFFGLTTWILDPDLVALFGMFILLSSPL